MRRLSAPLDVRRALVVLALIVVSAGSLAGRAGPVAGQDVAGPRVSHLFGSGSVTGGRRITLRVKLTEPAFAGGATVGLASANPVTIPLPGTVDIEAGRQERTFTVVTNAVAADARIRVEASLGGRAVGRAVLVKEPSLRGLHAQSVIRGGGLDRLTMCLTGIATPGGLAVAVAATPPGTLTVPAPLTIPAGTACATERVPTANVSVDTPIEVSAAYDGSTRSRGVTVRDFRPAGPAASIPIADFTFVDGAPLTVAAGTTVTWTNDDAFPHAVTAGGGRLRLGHDPGRRHGLVPVRRGGSLYLPLRCPK